MNLTPGRTQAPRADRDVAPVRALPPRLRDPRAERDADAFAGGRTTRTPPRPGSTRAARPGRGDALPQALRALAEPGLGVDLSDVRIRDDAEAHATVAGRGARAIATRDEVLFARGEYRPGTPTGEELVLHELAHVAEQREGGADVSQHDDPPGSPTGGIGRTPPPDDYAVATLAATDEDTQVLFERDRVTVDPALLERVRSVLASHSGAVVLRVHGYASGEGDERYNLNLSAHRVVAVRDAVAALLPAGSAVHLIAHGETTAFGETSEVNRRVGLSVSDIPRESTVEEDAARFLRRRPLGDEYRLHLDPSITALGQTLGTPGTAGPGAGAATTGLPVVQAPGIRRFGILDWQIGDPNRLVDPSSSAAPYIQPAPLGVVGPTIPWGIFAQDFRLRQVPFTEGDQTVIAQHWSTWYPLAQSVYGLGGPVRWIFDSPTDLMTTLTRKMISGSLSGDRPDAIEAFDQQLQRAGLSTPIYVPLPYGTWQFDPDFRNWRRPKIR